MKRKSYYNSSNNHSHSTGMGLLGVLQVIFIVLKLTNLIDWTWIQVFIPTFIGLGLFFIILVALIIIVFGASQDKL